MYVEAYENLNAGDKKGFWIPISKHFNRDKAWAAKHYQSKVKVQGSKDSLTHNDKTRISELLQKLLQQELDL